MDQATSLAIAAIAISLINSVFLGLSRLVGTCRRSRCCFGLLEYDTATQQAVEKIARVKAELTSMGNSAMTPQAIDAVSQLDAAIQSLRELTDNARQSTTHNQVQSSDASRIEHEP